MVKKVGLGVLIILLIFSSLSFGEDRTPKLGGGDSHNYYKYKSHIQSDISRTSLFSLRQKLGNEADSNEQMAQIVAFVGSPFPGGWILASSSLSSSAARTSYNLITDALLLHTSESKKFTIYYDEYRSEVPKTGYVKITKITAK